MEFSKFIRLMIIGMLVSLSVIGLTIFTAYNSDETSPSSDKVQKTQNGNILEQQNPELKSTTDAIHIETSSTPIYVTYEDRKDCEVVLEGKQPSNDEKKLPTLNIIQNEQTLNIDIDYPETVNLFSFGFNAPELSLNVKLPKSYVKTLEILSSSGDIYYSGGNTDLLKVETSSGNISLEALSGGSTVQSSSGNISATLADINKDININTSSGEVTLAQKKNLNYNLSIETSSGDIRLAKPLNSNDENFVETSVGSGGELLSIMTSSGDVTLK
jgi:DUF4097 and DUF4098 domain-containing protein YvlB